MQLFVVSCAQGFRGHFVTFIVCIPRRKRCLSLPGKRAKGHFVTLIEITVHQESITRSVQLQCIRGTAFSDTDSYLGWFSLETRPFQLITSLS